MVKQRVRQRVAVLSCQPGPPVRLRPSDLHYCTHCRRTSVFFEFSLCLSRACLGKKIAFKCKRLKKTVFCMPRVHAS